MLRIEISYMHYNGDYGIGSVFEEKYSFEIDESICYSNSIKSFCNNEDFGGNILSNVNVSIPFILTKNNIQRINNIINNIKSNINYLYNESYCKKDSFDFNRYNYTGIIINISTNGGGIELCVRDDEAIDKVIINEIKELLRINKIDEILNNSINNIISMSGDYNE